MPNPTIERVATVVSVHPDDGPSEGAGCAHHCLRKCCLPACKSKIIAQLNEGRDLKKHPTGLLVHQPTKFDFGRVGQEDEVPFRIEEGTGEKARYFEKALVSADAPNNVLAINVSPIGHGHVHEGLLLQRIDPESFSLALRMAATAGTPCFSLGYNNSLGAFATISHLHFLCYAERQALGEVSPEPSETLAYLVVWEISGHIVLKGRIKGYDGASDASFSNGRRFEEVRSSYAFQATGLVAAVNDDGNIDGRIAKARPDILQYFFWKILGFFSGGRSGRHCRRPTCYHPFF